MKPPDKWITFKSHTEPRNEFKRKVAEIKAENLREVTPLPGTEVTVANHNRAQTALNVFAPLGYIERCDTSPIMQVLEEFLLPTTLKYIGNEGEVATQQRYGSWEPTEEHKSDSMQQTRSPSATRAGINKNQSHGCYPSGFCDPQRQADPGSALIEPVRTSPEPNELVTEKIYLRRVAGLSSNFSIPSYRSDVSTRSSRQSQPDYLGWKRKNGNGKLDIRNWQTVNRKLGKPNQRIGTMKPPDEIITMKSHKESRDEFKRTVVEIKAENLRETTPLPGTKVTVANHDRAQTALNVLAPLRYIEQCDTSPITQVLGEFLPTTPLYTNNRELEDLAADRLAPLEPTYDEDDGRHPTTTRTMGVD